ncbi:unnamed protein product [Lampetra fluviatilis]
MSTLFTFMSLMAEACDYFLSDEALWISVRSSGYEAILADGFNPCSSLVARRLSIPFVSVVPAGPLNWYEPGLPTPPSYVPMMMMGHTDTMGFAQRVKNVAAWTLAPVVQELEEWRRLVKVGVAMDKVGGAMDKVGGAMDKVGGAMDKVGGAGVGGAGGGVGGARGEVGVAMDKVGGAGVGGAIDKVGVAMDKVGGAGVGGAGGGVGGARGEVGGAEGEVGGAEGEVGGAEGEVGGAMDKVGVAMDKVGVAMDKVGGAEGGVGGAGETAVLVFLYLWTRRAR